MPRRIAGRSLGLALAWTALAAGQEGEQVPRFLPPLPEAHAEPGEATPPPAPPTAGAIEDGFEGERPAWREEVADAAIRLRAHESTNEAAYDGERAERFDFVAGPGSHFYFSYELPRVPLTAELKASLFVRSSRTGVQLIARVVLPADLDPDTNQPFAVSVPGTSNDETDRWQRLEVADLVRAVERQVWVLRAKTRRPIRMEGAYLERLVVNLYGGPGDTEVLVDALRVAPVDPALAERNRRIASGVEPEPADGDAPEGGPPGSGNRRIELIRNRLALYDEPTRRHYPWFPTIIRAPGADPATLRRHGFDVFATRLDDDPGEAEAAVASGFLLMPQVGPPGPGPAAGAEEVLRSLDAYPLAGSVAFWDLGEGLGGSRSLADRDVELERTRAIVQGLADRAGVGVSRLTTATLDGDFGFYSRPPGRLDLMGAAAEIWGTTNEPIDFLSYLKQRQDLSALRNPDAIYWTWIPAVAPPGIGEAIWGQDAPPAWGHPLVQPEQIRVFTYAALAAGCRALAFRGDSELTREPGLARLAEMALLNAEIDLFESVFAQGVGPARVMKVYPRLDPQRLRTNSRGRVDPKDELAPLWNLKATAFDTPDRRSALVLVADFSPGTQLQPGQLAEKDIRLLVPGHQSATAWEVTLGGLRFLDRKRVPGGLEVTLPDFGPTTMVLITSDLGMKDALEGEVARLRATAVDLAIQQADDQLRRTQETHGQLLRDGHDPRDSADLLREAELVLGGARAAQQRGDLLAAWSEARRVARPLRVLMRQHFDDAFDALEEATTFPEDGSIELALDPVASPPLTSFNTLPQQWIWNDAAARLPLGANELPSGQFEDPADTALADAGWEDVGYQVEGLRSVVATVDGKPTDSSGLGRMLRLAVRPEEAEGADRIAPYQEHPVAAVRSPAVSLKRHQFVRISVLVRSERWATEGGGVIVRDSIGGATLQYRQHEAMTEWRRVVLYRRAPADCELTVTLGLASSFGDAYFDDLRIERAVRAGEAGEAPAPLAEADDSAVPRR